MDLATRLRQAIDATGQTQSWVAAHASLPEETISRIVTRQSRNPQVGTLMKLAPVLGVTVGWLLDERSAPVTASEAKTIATTIEIMRRLSGTSAEAGPNAEPIGHAGSRSSRQSAMEIWPEVSGLPHYDIPAEFTSRGAKWVFRASGDSMSGCGILDGDRLYVREVHDVRRAIGDVVVCRLAGAIHARRLAITAGRLKLVSENDRYKPIAVHDEAGEFALFGIVVGRSGDV